MSDGAKRGRATTRTARASTVVNARARTGWDRRRPSCRQRRPVLDTNRTVSQPLDPLGHSVLRTAIENPCQQGIPHLEAGPPVCDEREHPPGRLGGPPCRGPLRTEVRVEDLRSEGFYKHEVFYYFELTQYGAHARNVCSGLRCAPDDHIVVTVHNGGLAGRPPRGY
jgi:hypothetical protein